MTVCQFFLQGRCRFGDSCRNEHPRDGQRQSGFGSSSWPSVSTSSNQKIVPFSLETMTRDLNPDMDKPTWPLSSYGPAKHEPLLIAGLDESLEELRFRAVTALKSNSINEYLQYEAEKTSAADQVYRSALSNINQAYDQAVRASGSSGSSSFGGNAPASAFGGSSAFGGLTSSPSAAPAFGGGSSIRSGVSAFGQPAFGQPAFGQPAFGQTAFSPPAQSSSTQPVFGQPSVFGQPQRQSSVFGQPQQQSSVFGQTSQPQSSLIKPATAGAFGASSSSPSAFSGSTPTASNSGGFSAFAGKPSAFGLGTSTNTATGGGSIFGQPSVLGSSLPSATNTSVSAFGPPATNQGGNMSAFSSPQVFNNQGQQQQAAATPFGSIGSNGSQPSVFATPGSTSGTFGGATSSSVFAPIESSSAQAPVSAFGAPLSTTSSAFSNQQPAAPTRSKAQGPPDFATAKSTYKPEKNKYDALLPDNYLAMLPQRARQAFESKRFEWGAIPDWIPPKELR